MSGPLAQGTGDLFDRVLRRIAPVWPLSGYVAVNPYLGFTELPFSEAAAYLHGTVGERLIMDRRWYAQEVERGRLTRADILEAAQGLGLDADEAAWRVYLGRAPGGPVAHLRTLPELLDRRGRAPISRYVVEQISRLLAAYYDRGQATWAFPREPGSGLFAAWRHYTLHDRSLGPMGLKAARARLLQLPADAAAARAWARQILEIPGAAEEAYFLVLLKSVGGWAGWCRHLLWQAELEGQTHPDLGDLLAIRMAWEALLHGTAEPAVLERWRRQLHGWIAADRGAEAEAARRGEVLLRASEIAFRRRLAAGIRRGRVSTGAAARPRVQAAFCIDVRSEVYRRHLESAMPGLETIGFAGFFGVMLDYRRQGDAVPRPQTPVLLRPQVHVHERVPAPVLRRRLRRLRRSAVWKHFKLSAASCFSFVETAGLFYVGRLLLDGLGWHRPSLPPDGAGLPARERAGVGYEFSGSLTLEERLRMAESILTGLGLTRRVAPVVLLVGHGGSTTNNPHRAALDCGACAGQTGEVNARAAAALLNDPQVRKALAGRGWDLDEHCRFLPALHDTTTDRVELLERPDDSYPYAGTLAELRAALARAGDLTRLERIVRLEPGLRDPKGAAKNVASRAGNWSEVRPEWALAGNAAFIAAPRWRTRGMNLAGRAFLHDYDAAKDPDFSLLALIMTAPLVVANWINLQYYGSTVDNERQGCGNKVLHNVVGGTVGVLEGNGGDLRVGLSEQSLRDSSGGLQHEPLRLSAFIEAPAEAMDRIISENEPLRRLVDNRWLTVLRIGDDGSLYERRGAGRWVTV